MDRGRGRCAPPRRPILQNLAGKGSVRPRHTPTASLEQRSQIDNDSVDKIKHTLQRWEQRLTVENPKFVERYKKGEIHVLLHCSAGNVHQEYFIVFQGAEGSGDGDYPRVRFRRLWELLRVQARQMHSEIRSSNGNRETVFVDNTQAVQAPENIALPSLVWFDSADRIYSVLPKSLYLSKSFGFVFRGAVGYWEVDFAFANVSAMPESAREIVQRGPDVLDGIASNSDNRLRDWWHIRDAVR